MVSKIDTFVREGVIDTREMKRLLKIIVQTEIFKNENLPEPTNKRFFSRTSTIRNLVDQECLKEKINQREKTDKSVKIVLKVLLNKMVIKIQAMTLILMMMMMMMMIMIMPISVQEKLRELVYLLFTRTDGREDYYLTMERN